MSHVHHLLANRRAVPAHRHGLGSIRENFVGAGVDRRADHRRRPRARRRREAGRTTRSSRSGRRTRTASTRIRKTGSEAGRTRFQGLRPVRDRRRRAHSASPPSSRGAYRGRAAALQAPHIAVTVFMRGQLKHLFTRIYFPDEPSNADDPVLKLVPAERRCDAGGEEGRGRQGRARVERDAAGRRRDGVLRLLTFVTPANAGGQEPPMRLERISPDSGVRRGGDA